MWALIGSFGAGSTETAANALSGAAASRVILRWLGGESAAAEGNMAPGRPALGGLVAVSAAEAGLFKNLGTLKKIKELKEEEIRILKHIDIVKKNIIQFDIIEMRSRELIESISKSLDVYKNEYKNVYAGIFPLGVISEFIKQVKKRLFRRPYFSYRDLGYIRNLGRTAGFVLKMVDSPIF
jgi:hypothetical protein